MPTNARSLSAKAGFLVLANLIKYSVGFVMPIVLVRLLSQSDYGTYQQLNLISSAAVGLLTLGVPTSVYYFYHHVSPSQRSTLIIQSTVIIAASSVIGGLAIFFGSDILARVLNNPDIVSLLGSYAIAVALIIAGEHSIAFIISQGRFQLAVLFETIEVFLRLLLLLLPLSLGFGLHGVVFGLVSFALIRWGGRMYYLFFRSNVIMSVEKRRFFFGEQLNYSLPMALVSLSSMVGSTFNRGIIAASFSPAQYAVYAVGNLPIPLASVFQASVADVLRSTLPPLVRDGNHAEVVRLVRESSRKLSIVVLPSFVFLFAFAEQIITLFFTSRYQESAAVFRIFVCSVPLDMLILSAIPQVYGRTRVNLYVNISTMLVQVVLSYTLLRLLGLFGAVVASVLSQYYSSTVFAAVALRLTHSTVWRMFPCWHIARALLAAVAAAAVGHMTLGFSEIMFVKLAVAGTIYSASFLLIAVATGVLNAQDLAVARRLALRCLPRWGK